MGFVGTEDGKIVSPEDGKTAGPEDGKILDRKTGRPGVGWMEMLDRKTERWEDY